MADGLGIVSGTGVLPRLLAESCREQGRAYRVVVFEGTELDWTDGHPVISVPIERLGKLLQELEEQGCRSVCFAGKVERPNLDPDRLDMLGKQMAAALLSGTYRSDDVLLREIVNIFESNGFTVEGAHEVLPALLPSEGVLGAVSPDDMARKDAERGFLLAEKLGELDVGQGAVVDKGLCLGLETQQGTQSMLDYVARSRKTPPNPRGVLVKRPKPQQEMRVDLPAIGPETIVQAAAAGLAGIAIAAKGVMVLEREKTLTEADARGLFLWCVAP